MLIIPYDTESKSRNVFASPLGEEGHEVAKGCTRVRMIMILDVDVTAERRHYNTYRPLKGKRLTTFCASLALLQNVFAVHRRAIRNPRGQRPRQTYEPSGQGPVNPKNLSPLNPMNPHTGGVSKGAAGKREANTASQSAECLSCHMTLKVNPVTLTSYSSPVRAIPQPSAQRAVKLKNL